MLQGQMAAQPAISRLWTALAVPLSPFPSAPRPPASNPVFLGVIYGSFIPYILCGLNGSLHHAHLSHHSPIRDVNNLPIFTQQGELTLIL